jgi:hypothetical protein
VADTNGNAGSGALVRISTGLHLLRRVVFTTCTSPPHPGRDRTVREDSAEMVQYIACSIRERLILGHWSGWTERCVRCGSDAGACCGGGRRVEGR